MTLHDCERGAHTFNSLQRKSRAAAADALNPRALPPSSNPPAKYKAGSFKGFRPVQTSAKMMKVSVLERCASSCFDFHFLRANLVVAIIIPSAVNFYTF